MIHLLLNKSFKKLLVSLVGGKRIKIRLNAILLENMNKRNLRKIEENKAKIDTLEEEIKQFDAKTVCACDKSTR